MDSKYDAVIVGAGIIGLAVGWRSRERGLKVIVVDRGPAGGEASSVAAGMLAPITESTFGEESLLALALQSAARYPRFLADLAEASGLRIDPWVKGTIYVALDRDRVEALERLFGYQRSLGLEVEWVGHTQLRNLEPALHPSAQAGIVATTDKSVGPRRVLGALVGALRGAGGVLKEHSEVAEVLVNGGRTEGVRLSDGEVLAADQVVIAAGCWSGRLPGVPPEIANSVRPVKGQILRLRQRQRDPGNPILQHNVRTEEVYLVPRESGEVVVGGTVEEQGFDVTVTAGAVLEMLRSADEVVPGVREFELSEASAGLRPGSRDNAPILGQTSIAGLVAATGHFRNGILLAPITADCIANLLDTGEVPQEIVPFSPQRFAL